MPRTGDGLRQFEGDVVYDVWRSGGNPDAVSHDRLRDDYYDDRSVDEVVARELRSQRRPPEPESEIETEEEYPEEEFEEDPTP